MTFTIEGRVMQTPSPERLDVIERAVIEVDDHGVIMAVEDAATDAGRAILRSGSEHITTSPGSVLIPGLVDLHVHAPQWPQLGTGLDLPLERWLFEYTFPLEARYTDLAFARPIWTDLADGLLRHGTTTAVYFATVDGPATLALAEATARVGQRAYVGRVAMDDPEGTPDWYRDPSADAGVRASARSIDEITALDAGRGIVRPIITPRFTPACTDELLRGLGELAARTGVLVQTHASESDWAHGHALARFGTTDCAALDRFGLLRRGTVLDHANHVTDGDAQLLRARGAGIAHCPLSNAYFANAVLPTRRLVERGVGMGLGTDIAGGASPSLLRQVHEAVTMSRLLEDGVDRTDAGRRARRAGLGDRHDVRVLARNARRGERAGGAGRSAGTGTTVRRSAHRPPVPTGIAQDLPGARWPGSHVREGRPPRRAIRYHGRLGRRVTGCRHRVVRPQG